MPSVSWWRTSFGDDEIERIARAIRGEHLSQGPVTAEFERGLAAILDVPHVFATTNGSTALLMALIACGIRPGDEVIVPNRTWIATPHAVLLLGAKPVLVDCLPHIPIIDTDAIEAVITPATRAILPVHLNGRSADMRAIRDIAKRHDLKVIEDAAQAMSSRNADGPLGTQSDVGCFSLSLAKIISTGQGGYVATRDDALAVRLDAMRTHGVVDLINATYGEFGFNFRFTDILASIGLAQLEQLERRIDHVKRIHKLYAEGFAGLDFISMVPVDVRAGEIPIYVEVTCRDRKALMDYLRAREIQTRPFQPDLHLVGHLRTTRPFPNSERFARDGLVLPSGGEQPLENVHRVIEAVRDFGRSARA